MYNDTFLNDNCNSYQHEDHGVVTGTGHSDIQETDGLHNAGIHSDNFSFDCDDSVDLNIILDDETIDQLLSLECSFGEEGESTWRNDVFSSWENKTHVETASGMTTGYKELDTTSQSDEKISPFAKDSDSITSFRTSRRYSDKRGAALPKRALSAYNLFFRQERSRIYEELGHRVGFRELGKMIGHRWKVLSSEDKRQYVKLSVIESRRYRDEMDRHDEAKRTRIFLRRNGGLESTSLDRKTDEHATSVRYHGSTNHQENTWNVTPLLHGRKVNNPALQEHLSPTSGRRKRKHIMIDRNTPLEFRSQKVRFRDDEETQSNNNDLLPQTEIHQNNADHTLHSHGSDRSLNWMQHHEVDLSKDYSVHSRCRTNPAPDILYGPPSFRDDVLRALPNTAVRVESSRAPHVHCGMKFIVPDVHAYPVPFVASYRCYRMKRRDAKKFLDTLNWCHNEHLQHGRLCLNQQPVSSHSSYPNNHW